MTVPPILAYIGPGAGFAFLGSFLTIVISLLASFVSLLVWPFRMVWRRFASRDSFRKAQVKKIIFLGLDGLDPNLTEKWMAEGKLPHLSRLREQGAYRRLRTTFPALSPVAWSTFATGVNPGRHNIFDFLNRDLRTYAPELSSAKVRPPARFLKLGKWRIPLSRPSVELRRKSEPFWKILSRHSITSTILRVPITFPPESFQGFQLSAMSTPDLLGTQGTFSWFSTNPPHKNLEGKVDGGVCAPLRSENGFLTGFLRGPEKAQVSFTIELGDPSSNGGAGKLTIQGQTFHLKQGIYTPWIRLRFRGRGQLAATRGIVRFLLSQTQPDVSVYVTPIEIDPENPALPISHPSYYAVYLAKLLGSFATLGMAEDTWALNEGAIDEDAFLAQAKSIQIERETMFFSALDRTRNGVVACVFDTPDRVQHMFYRYIDPQRHETPDSPHHQTIENLYRDMDRVVGRAMEHVDRDTALFVLSDHGFSSFRRGVDLNAWLHQNGYLALLPGCVLGGDYFEGIDWSNTRAYTFGLSGIYLNLQGREAKGTVAASSATALKAELSQKLEHLLDPQNGETAILNVYRADEIYNGPYLRVAPDLVVGYAPGYRASWSAAVGKVTGSVFEDNVKCWSGDHCIDPKAVPGVLFTNRKLENALPAVEDPGIEDMAPTALTLFGIEPPAWMEGRTLVPLKP